MWNAGLEAYNVNRTQNNIIWQVAYLTQLPQEIIGLFNV